MLQCLAELLVGYPWRIFAVAAALVALWAMARKGVLRGQPHANTLWVPAILWLAYAVWEWLVLTLSPEANIRIDLMLIWPVVGIVTLWALLRAGWGWWSARRRGA
jgi:hypothetical protein